MKTLTLSIKQKYFDEILAGTKKVETREIRPTSEKKYVILNEKSEITDIIQYDAIKFLTGEYKGIRPYLIIKVVSSQLFEVVDENNEPIYYDYKGVQNQMINIEYTLGDIIEKNLG